MFCGDHLLAAKLRRSNIDASAGTVAEITRLVAQIRARWPLRGRNDGLDPCGTGSTAPRSMVRIVLRADSGFAREELMAWAERNRVDYVLGLARNARLVRKIAAELALSAPLTSLRGIGQRPVAKGAAERTGEPARRFKDFRYQTLDSWSRDRRVVGPSRLPPALASRIGSGAAR